MDNENKQKDTEKKSSNPNKTGMIFSLVLCVLALSIGAYSAINRSQELNSNTAENTTKPIVEVQKNQTDISKSTTVQTTTTSSNTLTSTTRATTSAKATVPTANYFTLPVGGTIKKQFDSKKLQYSETYSDWRLHLGVDIAAKKGTPVHSAGKGTVAKVYLDDELGSVVVIDHGNGIQAYYCGVVSVKVDKGDTVEIGEKIGVIGEVPSENVEETHLHFAVKRSSAFVDPIEECDIKLK